MDSILYFGFYPFCIAVEPKTDCSTLISIPTYQTYPCMLSGTYPLFPSWSSFSNTTWTDRSIWEKSSEYVMVPSRNQLQSCLRSELFHSQKLFLYHLEVFYSWLKCSRLHPPLLYCWWENLPPGFLLWRLSSVVYQLAVRGRLVWIKGEKESAKRRNLKAWN